jgi:pimeloyl-ACP methyl ester carboxylesterase
MDVLFVPGLNCTGALFSPQVKALELQFACHIADHGVADSMEAIAADILAKAPQRFALFGLSMGGYIACEIIRQAPERVMALALLDTRAAPDTPEEAERRHHLIALAAGGQFDQIHAILWPRLVHPGRLTDNALETIVLGMMRDTGAERFVRQQTAILNRINYLPLLDSIAVPTRVIVGAQDALTPPVHSLELHRRIEGSRFIEIPDCGHLSSLERPEPVNALLIDFLEEVIRSRD